MSTPGAPTTDAAPAAPPPGQPPAAARPRRRRRRLGWALLAAVAVVLLLGAWIGVRGLLAKHHLDSARAQLAALQREVLAGRGPTGPGLSARVAAVERETRAARSLTGDPVWSFASHLPVGGCTLRSASALVRVGDDLAARVLPPLADAGGRLDPDTVRRGTTVRLAPFVAARAPLATAEAGLRQVRPRIAGIPGCGALGGAVGLAEGRDELAGRTRTLLTVTTQARVAAALVPPMLGADGPRRYLLVVQNDAESRATGGIIGGFGLLTADRGRLSLDDISGNGSLPAQNLTRPAVDLGPELRGRYGPFQADRLWANANLSPDYPTVSRLYRGLYRAGTGITVDGTISIDPTTLSYLLAATKPARLPGGRVVSASTVVELVQSAVYREVADQRARDRFFADVGDAAYEAVTSGAGSSSALVRALGRAAGEGRLLVASRRPGEQRLLVSTPLGGALPGDPGPFLAVVTQNASASKLDYWMRRATDYRLRRLPDGTAEATVAVTLTSTAPRTLPPYVVLREDRPVPEGNPRAETVVWLSIYTGSGSFFTNVTLDGKPSGLSIGTERGHPVFSRYVKVAAGQTRTLVLTIREPAAGPVVSVRTQPLVAPERLTVHGADVRLLPADVSP